MTPKALAHLEAELEKLRAAGLLRTARGVDGDVLVLCSNDYLGYAAKSRQVIEPVATGSGGSRLISGDSALHREAERVLAAWVRSESALLFSSGYAANVGVITALAEQGDLIISDALNHASIIDGCRLSRARVVVVPHLDVAAIERALDEGGTARRRWVVTESYFSMDADCPDLSALRRICDERGAGLIVDEAHALGVFGPQGAGLCAAAGIQPDVMVGTLGKAVGLQGAFVAGDSLLRTWLWNRARSFVFSTGVSPLLVQCLLERVPAVSADDGGRARLEEVTAALRGLLSRVGATVAGRGPILPWIVGDALEAVKLSQRLLDQRILVSAIRPPTVPPGSSRLRLTASAALRHSDLMLVEAVLRGMGGS